MTQAPTTDPAGVDALLRDGRVVTVRPVVPADRDALERLHAGASPHSRYLRFFSYDETIAGRYADHVAEPGEDHFAVLATVSGQVVGVASAERVDPATPDAGTGVGAGYEVAVLVADAWHGTGAGTLLLEHLAAAAVDRGVRRFTAEVLATNGPMMDVFLHAGYSTRCGEPEDAVRTVELDLARTQTLADTIAERERAADAASVAAVLEPRSVVVVGAGRRPGGIGREVLANLKAAGFTGELAVVNRHADRGDRIGGSPAFRSAGLVPWPIDLAVVAVPAARVPDAVRDCGQAGARAVVVVSAGFADTGDGDAERELVALAHGYGMRLVGPNCLGVVNTDPAIRLNATFAALEGLDGLGGFEVGTAGVGLASQSGALGIAVLAAASRRGLPVADFVSLGNKADVSGNDLLLYWERNPRVAVAALYLESIGNPRRFRRIASRVSTRTPIVALCSGRSAAGARATASHTAATATPAAVSAALFRDAGVIATDTTEEFLDLIQLLASQNVPAGTRIGIVGNAGGPGALTADAAETAGGSVPAFGAELAAALRHAVPGAASVANPVDLGAAAGAAAYRDALGAILGSGEVDAVVAIHAATRAQPVDDVLRAVEAAAESGGSHGRRIPVAGVLVGVEPRHVDLLPWFAFGEAAAHALVRAGELGRWRRSHGPVATRRTDDVPEPDVGAAAIRAHLDSAPRDTAGFLAPEAAFGLLTVLGIPVCATQEVLGPDEAAAVAARWGVPVAVKTAAPGVVHKSDGGGVALGLEDHAAVVSAARHIVAATGSGHLVVQAMAPPGLELIAGLSVPPAGPPVLMAGAGGVHEAVMADHVLRTLPLTPGAASAMLGELRCAPLLHGHRGSPPLDRAAATDVLERLALLARIAPDITELDVNPLVVGEHGATAVDVKVRLAPSGTAAVADPVTDRAVRALDR